MKNDEGVICKKKKITVQESVSFLCAHVWFSVKESDTESSGNTANRGCKTWQQMVRRLIFFHHVFYIVFH